MEEIIQREQEELRSPVVVAGNIVMALRNIFYVREQWTVGKLVVYGTVRREMIFTGHQITQDS